MPSDSEKRQFSRRGFRKINAKLSILHALRHVCGIGGPTGTEMFLLRFSLPMNCNDVLKKNFIAKSSLARKNLEESQQKSTFFRFILLGNKIY